MPKSKICSPDAEQLAQLSRIPSAVPFLGNLDCSLVALAEGEVASFLIWRQVASDEFEILQLETLASFRRRGFARQLLQAFLRQKLGNIFLEVRDSNAGARQLYDSAGFTEIVRRRQYYTSPSEDAIVLKFCSC